MSEVTTRWKSQLSNKLNTSNSNHHGGANNAKKGVQTKSPGAANRGNSQVSPKLNMSASSKLGDGTDKTISRDPQPKLQSPLDHDGLLQSLSVMMKTEFGAVVESKFASFRQEINNDISTKFATLQLSLETHCVNLVTEKIKEQLSEVHTSFDHIAEEFNATNAAIEKLRDDLIKPREDVTKLKEELMGPLTDLQHFREEFKSKRPVGYDQTVRTVLQEVQDKNDRAANIILFGLESKDFEDPTFTSAWLVNTFDLAETSVEVISCKRFQGEGSLPRPVRVTLGTRDMKRLVLSKTKLLKDKEDYASVYIKPDLTRREQWERKRFFERRTKTRAGDQPGRQE